MVALLIYSCKETPFDENTVIVFEDTATASLPLDQYSQLTLKVKIDKNADNNKRTITFSTDNGKFTNDTNTITVIANSDGYAETSIKAEKLGVATVKASILSYTAVKIINFITADADSFFSISGNLPVNTPADGVSTAEIQTSVNLKIPMEKRLVTFSTDAGTFQNGQSNITLSPDINGKTNVYLKHRQEGPAHVALSLNGVIRNVAIDFVKAVPDQLNLQTPMTLQAGDKYSAILNILVYRTVGKPSAGFFFDYLAKDTTGKEIGIFNSPKSSDEEGKSAINYSTMDTVYKGNIFIKISVKGYSSVNATVPLRIIK